MTAHELKEILKVLDDCNLLTEEPPYDTFVDLLDTINKNLAESLAERIRTEMVVE